MPKDGSDLEDFNVRVHARKEMRGAFDGAGLNEHVKGLLKTKNTRSGKR